MRDQEERSLRKAVDAVVSREAPHWAGVYARVTGRNRLALAGCGLSAVAAAAVLVVALLPPPPPVFSNQVVAFVGLVWEE